MTTGRVSRVVSPLRVLISRIQLCSSFLIRIAVEPAVLPHTCTVNIRTTLYSAVIYLILSKTRQRSQLSFATHPVDVEWMRSISSLC